MTGSDISTNITESQWRAIAHLWAELAACPVNEPDEATQRLLELLEDFAGASRSLLVIATRSAPHTPSKPDPLLGWRPTHQIYRRGTCKEFARIWSRKHVFAPAVRAVIEGSGVPRTLLRSDVAGEDWANTEIKELLDHYGLVDRVTTVYPLTSSVEFFVVLDRTDALFTEEHGALVSAVMRGVGPLCWRLAMSYGLLESQLELTRRERETLIHLLGPASEKQIAGAMGLTYGSAHQNVVAVFRKFGVQSRAELTARWMAPPPSPDQALLTG